MNNEELTKKIIVEKDKAKLQYQKRLTNIESHYGVDFDVEHLKDSNIKNITFLNLKYKNTFNNLSITYDEESRTFDYMNYEFLETRNVKSINHRKIISYLEKEYKLKFLILEIERANSEHQKELENIDRTLKYAPKGIPKYERTLMINKKEENE